MTATLAAEAAPIAALDALLAWARLGTPEDRAQQLRDAAEAAVRQLNPAGRDALLDAAWEQLRWARTDAHAGSWDIAEARQAYVEARALCGLVTDDESYPPAPQTPAAPPTPPGAAGPPVEVVAA